MTSEEWDEDERGRAEAWQARLGRLRLGAEPLEEQVARHRRVTWALTFVMVFIGILFFSMFTGFGRADIGVVLVCILIGPILFIGWRDYFKLAKRAKRYLDDASEQAHEDRPPTSTE